MTAARTDIPKSEVRAMLDLIDAGRTVELPDCGHDLHLEKPALWRREIAAFLAEAGSDRPTPGSAR